MKHNHGPTEWCSRCPGEWLRNEVPQYEPSKFEWTTGPIMFTDLTPQSWHGKRSPSNITKTPMRITTEFGSIRP